MAKASDSTSPKVSIIVPVYKVEQYLRRCLDSIVAQTFTDWECILIDDGSPDKSGDICDEYAERDGRFRVIHQENKGVSAARNAGLDAARGEWIGFVDSDDWVENNFIELLYLSACESGADIVGCDALDETEYDSILSKNNILLPNFDLVENLLRNKLHGGLCLYFIKHERFKNISFVEGMNICEDLLVSIKLFVNKPKTLHISKPLYHYTASNTNSITRSVFSKEKCLQLVKSAELIEQVLKENQIYDEHISGIILRKKYIKLKILYKSSFSTSMKFYGLYPGLSKHVKVTSLSTFFQKILLFCTEIRCIPAVWMCLKFFKFYWKNKKENL